MSNTNPQPSGNPLNLLYKGVFSTRLSKNNISQYGHYLDKLYQIRFLGLGTVKAEIVHNIVHAVMLRQTSIDGRVDVYRATPDKYSESVILEALGGTPSKHRTNLYSINTFADRVLLQDKASVLGLFTSTIGLTEVDIISLLSLYKTMHSTVLPKDVITHRLSLLKRAAEKTSYFATDISVGWLDGQEEKATRGLLEAIVEHDLNRRYDRNLREVSDEEIKHVIHAAKVSSGVVGSSQEGNTTDFNSIELVDVEGKLLRQSDILFTEGLFSKPDEKSELDREYGLADMVKVKMATYMLDVIMRKVIRADESSDVDADKIEVSDNMRVLSDTGAHKIMGGTETEDVVTERRYTRDTDVLSDEVARKDALGETDLDVSMRKPDAHDNMLIISDMDAVGRLLRKADVAAESAYLVEKYAHTALTEIFTTANMTSRQTSLAYYILYNKNPDFKKIIDTALIKYADSHSVGRQSMVDAVQELGKEILEKYGTTHDYGVASKSIDEAYTIHSVVKAEHLIRSAGEEISRRFNLADKDIKHVSIEFHHEIKAEDSKGYVTLLNKLYEDFKVLGQEGSILEPSGFGGENMSRDALVIEHLIGESTGHNKVEVQDDYYVGYAQSKETEVTESIDFKEGRIRQFSVLDHDSHGEMWSEQPTYVSDSRETELFGGLTSEDEQLVLDPSLELLSAEMTSEEPVLTYEADEPIFGELTNAPNTLSPDYDVENWGELTNEEHTQVLSVEQEMFGELSNEPTPFQPEIQVEVVGVKLHDNEGFEQKEYEIAVLGCAEPDLRYRRRPPLEPDKVPPEPLFEWVCTEGYVCDDWLIVPLKDFNFENPEQDGFYDPITFEPYFPTGQVDSDGDPYVLPPYSVLNEPISNGEDVGGKVPMSIDPCNLYSFIEYAVKIYDAYKSRFQASTPIDTISRVMNMMFEQVQKLIAEWDETKPYTPDELWRIYRFIRWMALGITNRFYRVKVEYTYGDFVENFELYPFTDLLRTDGTARKWVNGQGWVLEGHPLVETMENSATLDFKLPQKTQSSTISFELGNVVPERPDELVQGGTVFQENFEGVPSSFKIQGDGWIPVSTQGGTGLGVEDPARTKTYRTTVFNVPTNAVNPRLTFNYGIDTNMDTRLRLKRLDGTVVWQSAGVVTYGSAQVGNIPSGSYYFEVIVPQTESSSLTNINFTATQIQNEWQKVGYQTTWEVSGNVIYERENTPGIAMVVNPQWVQDSEYEMEVEFFTEDVRANYGLIDWLGIVLNYKDSNNYYLFGTWSDLDRHAKGGLLKVENGRQVGSPSAPTWEINPDFRFELSRWHKLKAVVKGNRFTVYIDGTRYLDITDNAGWGHGASGLMAWSNPLSSFRNFKYKGKPRFDAFIDNVRIDAPSMYLPAEKPKYAIDFFLDGNFPRIQDYLEEGKRAFSFPILEGEHNARWVFKKIGSERSFPQDASFLDNIIVRGMKTVGAEVVEEFTSCGGHLAVKLLIENLLEYYRRHHQGCKGERNIWIIE